MSECHICGRTLGSGRGPQCQCAEDLQSADKTIERYRNALERFSAYDPLCNCGMCVPCHVRTTLGVK